MIKFNEKMLYHIICLIILLNIIQFGIRMFNITFNGLMVEYILIMFILIFYKKRIINYYTVLVTLLSYLVFLIALAINDNETIRFYIYSFTTFSLPLLIVFIFKIDYKEFLNIFSKYVFVLMVLYVINMVFDSTLLNDYMTFGYNGIFCSIFLFIYSFYNKKKMLSLCSFFCSIIFLINGARGCLLIITMSLLLIILFSISGRVNIAKKIIMIIFLIIVSFTYNQIIDNSLKFINEHFDSNLYTVKQFNNMASIDRIDELLSGRYYIYKVAVEEINNNFFTGIGIGTFQEKYGFYPHNIFLDVFTTYGFIIGIGYFLFLIIIGKKVFIIAKDNVYIKILFIFCLALSMKLLLSKTFIYDPYIWLLISCFLNIIAINELDKKNKLKIS